VQKDYDVTIQDFRPVFSAVLAERPDFIATTLFGGLIPRFTTQYLGGGNRTPFGVVLSELGATRALGTSVPDNVMYATTRTRYTELLGTSARPWIRAYSRKFRLTPGDTALQVIGAFLAFKASAERARSLDGSRVSSAFRCLRYYEPRGWVTIRALNGQADVPSVVGQMRFQAGREARLVAKDRIFVYSHDTWDAESALARIVPEEARVAKSACK
jgi:branched-chain amino acid transport system substrate-binding protein